MKDLEKFNNLKEMKKIITIIILSSLLFSCVPQNSQTVVVWNVKDLISLWVAGIVFIGLTGIYLYIWIKNGKK